jgi:hypothetical protein
MTYEVGVVALGKARASMLIAVLAAGLLASGCGSDKADSTDAGMKPDGGQQTAAAPKGTLQLGQAAITAGAKSPFRGPGGGQLEITPTSVIYSPKTRSLTPKNGQFLTVIFMLRPVGDIAAMETAPIDGGGWTYITPDGKALEQGNGESFSVTLNDYNRPMTVVGASVGSSESWDITVAQAGGVLQYTDGAKKTYRWQIPAADTGPQVDEVKKALA